MNADGDQCLTEAHQTWTIEAQRLHRGSTCRREADHMASVAMPGEMILPLMPSRMKEHHSRFSQWVSSSNASEFVVVTSLA